MVTTLKRIPKVLTIEFVKGAVINLLSKWMESPEKAHKYEYDLRTIFINNVASTKLSHEESIAICKELKKLNSTKTPLTRWFA